MTSIIRDHKHLAKRKLLIGNINDSTIDGTNINLEPVIRLRPFLNLLRGSAKTNNTIILERITTNEQIKIIGKSDSPDKIKEIEIVENAPIQDQTPIQTDLEPEVSEPEIKQVPTVPVITPDQIEAEKNKIRKEAEQEIAKYKEQKKAEIDNDKTKVLEQAKQEGFEAGIKKGESQLNQKVKELFTAINQIEHERKETLSTDKQDILELAVTIAERIIESEISQRDDVLMNVIDDAISRITDKDKVIIRVNPSEAKLVKANRNHILDLMSDIKSLEVQEDYKVERGGCIIETNLGYIDATVTAKLDSIKQALFKVYEEELEEQGRTLPKKRHSLSIESSPILTTQKSSSNSNLPDIAVNSAPLSTTTDSYSKTINQTTTVDDDLDSFSFDDDDFGLDEDSF
jgi:flagellar assembly protein FliH